MLLARIRRTYLDLVGIAGIWILFLVLPIQALDQMPPLCPARWVGGTCLTCGVTHSVHCLVHGRFADAVHFNPAGVVVVIAAVRRCVTISFRTRSSFLNHSLIDMGLFLSFFALGALHYIEWI